MVPRRGVAPTARRPETLKRLSVSSPFGSKRVQVPHPQAYLVPSVASRSGTARMHISAALLLCAALRFGLAGAMVWACCAPCCSAQGALWAACAAQEVLQSSCRATWLPAVPLQGQSYRSAVGDTQGICYQFRWPGTGLHQACVGEAAAVRQKVLVRPLQLHMRPCSADVQQLGGHQEGLMGRSSCAASKTEHPVSWAAAAPSPRAHEALARASRPAGSSRRVSGLGLR
jgi:hypothetical protein